MTKVKTDTTAKIFVILARNGGSAVVIRRGPNRHVQLLKWNTHNDQFEPGQWFKGRIHEHLCDLSSCGNYFVYVALKYQLPLDSWTALSHPPYFTALALWNAVKGIYGGTWTTEDEVLLTKGPWNQNFQPGSPLAVDLEIERFVKSYSFDESHFFERRLIRDGWTQAVEEVPPALDVLEQNFILCKPLVLHKPLRDSNQKWTLNMCYKNRQDSQSWRYSFQYNITDYRNEVVCSLGKCLWADLDKQGDLLYALDGKIFRLRYDEDQSDFPKLEEAVELIDLNNSKFEPIEAPQWAKEW